MNDFNDFVNAEGESILKNSIDARRWILRNSVEKLQ
jgi:hypothetical protein